MLSLSLKTSIFIPSLLPFSPLNVKSLLILTYSVFISNNLAPPKAVPYPCVHPNVGDLPIRVDTACPSGCTNRVHLGGHSVTTLHCHKALLLVDKTTPYSLPRKMSA